MNRRNLLRHTGTTAGIYALAVFIISVLFFIPVTSEASGTFRPFPPRPPVSAELDQEKYELGRAVFTKRVRLTSQNIPARELSARRARLETLQRQLPRSIQNRIDLLSFAPLLTAQQFQALEYYLVRRYKIRETSSAL